MITLKNAEQIEKMRASGALLHQVLTALRAQIQPGVTTRSLDALAEQMIREGGGIPSFKGYNGFPASICASVDDEVVHGFPSDVPLREGQLLSVDCGAILGGWQSDSAFSVAVGEASAEVKRLIKVTEECFWVALEQVREGNRIGDIGHAVQKYAEANGYSVIRALCGHGIGREMHEDPSVPNYGDAGHGVRMRAGMTIAIEPMIAMGKYPVYLADNQWTYVTRDHSVCSHYEHTVAVTQGAPTILTLPSGAGEGAGR